MTASAAPAPSALTESWRALGTYVVVRVLDPDRQAAAEEVVRDVLAEVDAALSRFRADSELSLANQHAGQWWPASDLLVTAVRAAVNAAHDTGGLIDPALGELLIAAGYDRTFDALIAAPDPVTLPTRHTGSWQDIELQDNAIRVPPGLSLDLGATGKAFAADLAAVAVAELLACPVVVSVGGDVRVATPDGTDVARPWEIAIAPDLGSLENCGPMASVGLSAGGLATSSRTGRRWRRGGAVWHHLFDPRTGHPADGPWVCATAWGPTAADANVTTTAALVLGAGAPDWLRARGAAALLIGEAGTSWSSPAWDEALLHEAERAR